ncbi:MAG TPA: beta-ketoacyl-ACP synthase II [Vitreimonas sp.]|nr:beta-ketoacyl-ACP synthase II [Vitreimonas sp.]
MRKPDYNRRVAVTGLGVISPVGNDKETAWDNLVRGVSGIREITRFDVSRYEQKAGGEVRDFDPNEWMDPKAVRRSESTLHFGVAAGKQALADSGFEINDDNRTEVGIVFGSGAGGQRLMTDAFAILHEKGPNRVAPTFIAHGLIDSSSGMLAIETGAIGHNMAVVTACATGTHNVAEGAEAIRRGDCIAVISGSTESPLLETAHAGFGNMRGLGNPRPGEPISTVSRPFDATRDGFVLGEGAAGLFLEDLEHAVARGAHIYAEVVGYGSAADGWDMIQPVEHGAGSARAMRMAIERRDVPADEVDLINPHGTSTPLGDKRESEAIWAVFGERAAGSARQLAISGTKSMTGHLMGAAGAFEAFATVMSVDRQCVPPTINYRDPDPDCDLWVVTEATPMPIRYALSNNIGLGGHNGAVVFKRYETSG